MTYTSEQIDLVMNKLKRSQFESLKLSSLVKADQFYYITDDTPTETLISVAISSYYKIGSQKFVDDVSAMISSDATYVFQNEVKSNLDIYKVSREQYEALKSAGQIKPNAYYYIVDDETTEQKITSALSNYYLKSETSSAVQISEALKNVSVDLSEYYKKSETSSSTEISNALNEISSEIKAQDAAIVQKIAIVNQNISSLSDDIKDLQENKLDPEDLIPVYNDLLSPDEVKLYKGPGQKDITLSVGTGTQLCTYTATLSDFYLTSETSSKIQIANEFKKYQLSGNYLLSSNLSFNYNSSTKYIYLKAFGNDIGTVNCADFIKDGMLSTVQLCGNVLVFKFNTDAGITPISVNLSSFVDNYDAKITALSNAITADVKNLADNYYKKSETSSATQIENSLTDISSTLNSQDASIYQQVVILSGNVEDLDNSLSGYWKKADITLNTNGQIKVGSTQITALTAHQSLTGYETKSDLTTNYYNKTQVDSISSTLSGKIPTKVSQLTNDAGYTTNVGTITEIKMNGSSKGTSGVVDLGTVLTEHQSLTAYYPKTETSSSTQLNTAFSKYQLTSDMSKYELTSDLTSNYYKKTDTTLNTSGVLKIGSTQITALTAHQSLADYATKAFVSAMISTMIDDALTAQYGNVLNEEY